MLWSMRAVWVLLAVRSSVAVRINVRRTSLFLRNYGNDNGAGDVGPGATVPNGANIVNGYAPAITVQRPSIFKVVAHPDTKSNAVVTKEFCLQVLKDVATRQPPYFVDDKFTGECRKSLVDQCGDRVCEWAKHYKSAASDCPQCPNSCDAHAPSRTAFFASFPSSMQVVGTQHFYMVVHNEMLAHAGSGSGTLPVDAPRLIQRFGSGSGSGSNVPTRATTPGSNVAPPAADSPCPMSGCPRTEVTKGFCKQMLQDVIEGKAPYFIEGKFTGESRTELISQCSLHICGWALKVQVAGIPQCGASACCLPETCKLPKEYLKDVIAKGQLLDVIKLVGNSNSFLKNLDPLNPPKSIPAQQDPPHPNLRGPLSVEKIMIGGPTPNDPRDPDFKKSDKSDQGKDDEQAETEAEEKYDKDEKKVKKVKKKSVEKQQDDNDDDKEKKRKKKKQPEKDDDDDDAAEDDHDEGHDGDKGKKNRKKKKTKKKNMEKDDDDDADE